MTYTPSHTRRIRRTVMLAATILVFLPVTTSSPARSAEATSTDVADKFQEIGQLPLPTGPEEVVYREHSGWLVLDPPNRRGYMFTEAYRSCDSCSSRSGTIIESFDLDTLKRIARTTVPGIPIASGFGEEGAGQTTYSGDIVHAVDSIAKRLYIPFSAFGTHIGSPPVPHSDAQRAVSHVLIIDEELFDRQPDTGFGAFSLVGADQRFSSYPLLGVAISRHHVAQDKPGKLLALFASPYPFASAPFTDSASAANVPGGVAYDHTLVQWDVDPDLVPTGRRAPDPLTQAGGSLAIPLPSEWQQPLVACATAPITSPKTSKAESVFTKSFQWDFLATPDAVFVACQSGPGSGAVARVALDSKTGDPAAGATQQIASLGKPIADVLADEAAGRLYLRSFGGGATWWAFDVKTMRYAGSIAAHLTDSQTMAAGIDPGTGRLYTLTADSCVPRQGGGSLPVRGGIKFAEARLDPVPAQQNIRPDMAYGSWWRVHVDSVTRRVYVRRGVSLATRQLTYPECDLAKRVTAPQEFFYRVFEDRIPVANQPALLDDAPFTTNVPEHKDLTQASYVGSGTGYGARILLTGGLDAATNGTPTTAKSLCGRDDRELLVGSVGNAEVSDQSTRAEAASLDADSRTQEALGDPLNRCRPQAPEGPSDPSGQGATLNACYKEASVAEFAFDSTYKDKRDVNPEDGCPDRTGTNDYLASCLDDETPGEVVGPTRAAPRDGFKAKATCEAPKDHAAGKAEGSLSSKEVDAFQEQARKAGLPISAEPVRVGRASSTVDVERSMGKGVTVTVDSWARDIEIPGLGTIGAVRTIASSTATGRDGRAKGTFERTICDVKINNVVMPRCIDDRAQQEGLVKQLNDVLGGRGEVRLRMPDHALREGTDHGYLSAVQRDGKELFGDQTITRDRSLAVPGLEIILYQGDGGEWGAGRQVLQLAAAQTSTSYGIICTYGQADNGKCSRGDEQFDEDSVVDDSDGVSSTDTIDPGPLQVPRLLDDGPDEDSPIVRILKQIPRAIAQAMQLLFNNPREVALLATVWALLYAPCYLGERRRSIGGLLARRVTSGGVG